MSREKSTSESQQTLSGGEVPDDPPSFHAGNCRRDDCDFATVRTSVAGVLGDLENHMKDDHGVTDDEWREIRRGLE